ncbi:MAG: non-canonical purine NTP pyrophosphatase [Bdellovibrionota bacterium]
MNLFLASTNPGKKKECEHFFSYFYPQSSLHLQSPQDLSEPIEIVEDALSFEGNALKKALSYWKRLEIPCLADDSGLVVPALNGQPGIYSARYAGPEASDKENNQKLIEQLRSKNLLGSPAFYVCAMVLIWKDGSILSSKETCEGVIHENPQGSEGFGYDPHFYLPDQGKTMAEITREKKNTLSHRAKALEALGQKIRQFL